MKNVVLISTKKFKKVSEKLFTEKQRNSKIRKDNPLKVNCKNYRRGSGLLSMKSEELIIAKELSKKYNQKEKLILKMIEKCNEMGSSIKNIEEFYSK